MKKINQRTISETIIEAKRRYSETLNQDILTRINRLLELKKEFQIRYRELNEVKRVRLSVATKLMHSLYEILPRIEMEFLRLGGRAYVVSNKIPKDLSKQIEVLKLIQEKITSMRSPSLKPYLERIEGYYNEALKAEEESIDRYKSSIERYEKIKKEVEGEILALKQLLNPESFVIINTRERFD